MEQVIRTLEDVHRDLADALQALQGRVLTPEASGWSGSSDLRPALGRLLNGLLNERSEALDLILERICQRNAAVADTVRDLRHERAVVVDLLRRGVALTDRLGEDSRAAFEVGEELSCLTRELVASLSWHLQCVEQQIVPMALLLLSARDWAEIHARLHVSTCSSADSPTQR